MRLRRIVQPSVHTRLWRIRLAYGAGKARVSMMGAVGAGWHDKASAYCNVYVGSLNTPDGTKVDRDAPKEVKVGHGLTIEDALSDAERWIKEGKTTALVEAAEQKAKQ